MFELMMLLIVVGTSIWVLTDAIKIKAQPGLLTGVFDMGPGAWFLSCLLLWIVAFPCYLAKRNDIIEAVRSWENRTSRPAKKFIADPVDEWEKSQKQQSASSIRVYASKPVPEVPTVNCPTCAHPIIAAAIRAGENICQKCGNSFTAELG